MHNPIEPKTWDQGAKWAIARKDHLNPAQTRCLGWTFSYKKNFCQIKESDLTRLHDHNRNSRKKKSPI